VVGACGDAEPCGGGAKAGLATETTVAAVAVRSGEQRRRIDFFLKCGR
jgi:hypothetical protein